MHFSSYFLNTALGFCIVNGMALVMVIVFAIIAVSQKYSNLVKNKAKGLPALSTTMSQNEVFNKIKEFSKTNNYKMKFLSEKKGCIILGDSFSLSSWGFFYPVYVSALKTGRTLIEIGIKSRFQQDQDWNPIRKNKLGKIFEGILTAVDGVEAPPEV